MANALNIDLKGKHVVLVGFIERTFFCEDGFGCYPFTRGQRIFGHWADGSKDGGVRGSDVLRLATDEEIQRFEAGIIDKPLIEKEII